jgi:hypothetical protein
MVKLSTKKDPQTEHLALELLGWPRIVPDLKGVSQKKGS